MPTTYYTYKDPFPATVNHPNAVQLESTADWPKTFRYNFDGSPYQGIHPPAPVYNANQPAPQSWYYGGQPQQQAPQGGYYYFNGQYYQMPAAPTGTSYQFPSSYYYYQPSTKSYFYNSNAYPNQHYPSFCNQSPTSYTQYYKTLPSFYPGWKPCSYMNYLAPNGPTTFPVPACPATMTAQAATAAATNAALAAMPQGPNYFVGSSTDYATQQAIIAAQLAQMGASKPPPTQLAPYKPADGQQFWCKELDGSWTLRTHNDIVMGKVSPGHWERHSTSGYFYWVRSTA